jgi:preprotein translocase subunit SecD
MRVKTEDYLKRLAETSYAAADLAARDAGFQVTGGRYEAGGGNYRVVLEVAVPSKAADIKTAVEKKVELYDTSTWSYSTSGNQLVWSITSLAQLALADSATTQAMNIIDSRINSLGVAEPTLQTHGAQNSHQILLQMPGVQDPQRIKKLLQGESRLELVHVISPPSPAPSQTYTTEAEAIQSLGGTVTSNRRVLPYKERTDPKANSQFKRRQKALRILSEKFFPSI